MSPSNALQSVKASLMGLMASWGNATCAENCSGHGECHNGTCLCEIQFEGSVCRSPNLVYHVGLSGCFFGLALVCLVQLVCCIVAEWQKMKAPSWVRAFRVTTQKLLYFLVFLASLIRGAYFTSPMGFQESWSSSLMSAYYPLMLSGSSLLVCFWAEVFHLRDIRWEKPQFLSKSFLGFITFNIITYSLLLGEFVTTQLATVTTEERSFYTHIFNGCYAVLLLIVVIFFLIYGVEVYFKLQISQTRRSSPSPPPPQRIATPAQSQVQEVRGGFLSQNETASAQIGQASKSRTPQGEHERSGVEVTAKLFDENSKGAPTVKTATLLSTSSPPTVLQQQVDVSQLHQSRVGLLSQALMLMIVVGFLISDTLSGFWKTKVPLNSRNWHDIVFRIVEIGVALWFPCVLWNCMSPDQLWILNPKRLLKKLDLPEPNYEARPAKDKDKDTLDGTEANEDTRDCWICYDNDRNEPLIQPCQCTGDVSHVHHDCLRQWLVESAANTQALVCKVCNTPYQVERGTRLDWQHGFTIQHWLKTTAIVSIMCISGAGAWVTIQLFENPVVRISAAGFALLVQYVCVRLLGLNTVIAYQRAKVSSLSIVNGGAGPSATATPSSTTAGRLDHVATISETVAVDIPKAPPQQTHL